MAINSLLHGIIDSLFLSRLTVLFKYDKACSGLLIIAIIKYLLLYSGTLLIIVINNIIIKIIQYYQCPDDSPQVVNYEVGLVPIPCEVSTLTTSIDNFIILAIGWPYYLIASIFNIFFIGDIFVAAMAFHKFEDKVRLNIFNHIHLLADSIIKMVVITVITLLIDIIPILAIIYLPIINSLYIFDFVTNLYKLTLTAKIRIIEHHFWYFYGYGLAISSISLLNTTLLLKSTLHSLLLPIFVLTSIRSHGPKASWRIPIITPIIYIVGIVLYLGKVIYYVMVYVKRMITNWYTTIKQLTTVGRNKIKFNSHKTKNITRNG